MISDRYIVKPYQNNIDTILDISEHMAGCYGFNAKERLMIRLITEEMILSVHSGLLLSPGELWFSVSEGMFTITASVGTDVFGMPKEQRKKLLELAGATRKSGLFGLVQDFMDYIAVADSAMDLQSYADARYGATEATAQAASDEVGQHCRFADVTADGSDDIAELEIKLLNGFADDVQVVNKGKRLEISVMKEIHFSFMLDYISSGSK